MKEENRHTIRLSDDTEKQLKEKAEDMGISKTAVIKLALTKLLKEQNV